MFSTLLVYIYTRSSTKERRSWKCAKMYFFTFFVAKSQKFLNSSHQTYRSILFYFFYHIFCDLRARKCFYTIRNFDLVRKQKRYHFVRRKTYCKKDPFSGCMYEKKSQKYLIFRKNWL